VNRPSAALVKALLINGAVPMLGQFTPSDAGDAPGNDQGFGRVNIPTSLGLDGSSVAFRDEGRGLQWSDQASIWIELPADSMLTATLVWTDPPGDVLTNNLNLVVVDSAGTARHGNLGPGDKSFDTTNNVERVRWLDIAQGKVVMHIKADHVRTPQTYALAWRIGPRPT